MLCEGKFNVLKYMYFLQVDNLVLQLGQGRTDDIKDDIEKCIDNSGDDKCMWAFKGFGCFKKSNLSLIQQSVKKV